MSNDDTKPRVSFFGANGTVTGSRTLLSVRGQRILVDCGLFQGFKELRLRNRAPLPVSPASIDAVVLTHAHIDHSGYIPLLVRLGFAGRIYCTSATADLCRILLPDSAYLEEEAAARANRYQYSRHHPALPLYTVEDAQRSLRQLEPVARHAPFPLPGALSGTFRHAGHIPGASTLTIEGQDVSVGFSGDLGRPGDPLLPEPEPLPPVARLVCESTYGNREHPDIDPEAALADIVNRTVARRGNLIIPAFAVGRTQRVLYHLYQLKKKRQIADIPVFLNSPLADAATEVFRLHTDEGGISSAVADAVCRVATVATTVEESIALNRTDQPTIIIAGSGMASGGRVIHHIRVYGPHKRNTILFTGFQAGGTRGAAMVAGVGQVKIFGEYVPIEAEVAELPNLSAHADADDLLAWLASQPAAPGELWLTHGNEDAADALRQRVEEELGWSAYVPHYLESKPISG